MKSTPIALILMMGALLATRTFAQEEFPGLEILMTPEQMRASGLHRLSPAELDQLNEWLRNYSSGEKQTAREEVRGEITREAKLAEDAIKRPERIVSQIQGEFRGWTGHTQFHLMNGQVWQQRIKGRLYYIAKEPKVEISRNLLGFYEMKIVGTSYTIGVKRIN